MTEIRWFDDNTSLAPALAAAVAEDVRAALATDPAAILAVSGGRSPVPVFEALREADLDWARVIVTLVDERWVPETDPASNAALVKTHLLQGKAAAARFLPLYTGDASAAAAETRLARSFAELPRPFAALILGMGDDGHTASLFPASPNLEAGLALGGTVENTPPCLAQVGAVAPTERVSLTLPWILDARHIYLQFGGAGKVEVFNAALAGPNRQYPVSFVLAQTRTPVTVFAARS
ncbi:6-phosphogluconolactonase [Methylococcus capsulatus]|jgi:6-phosphogluconolactonase|uniref:6-phosphogluconolactonase n=1 Tax=Methylococcus capsulatus TaxID=414 RepID=A0AA35XZW4_METCP|nr:6-phosphogluconolactonase [Methylococcus capsulatus]QXP86467.1 6-phosphogluconolactonase [Methylococcus capsulatus]QXP89315.1 6-phosphogluconolactonase [Methylococcus capsulatus]QXP93865.1 6-phosphogluconolactonase [Methylococcus capsulatus]UQN11413.1 6-phosphogluconolactonase [Methylococcus capsulatus]CAI8789232.1 6-phosphogluconolactonase [Methylococcus capsulatus]